jgi:hypothetical protein
MAKQIYKQEEISHILKRAAEMQGAEGEGPSTGLSLAELQQIAEDSGIDPKYVRLAVADFEEPPDSDKPNFWGGPLRFIQEREVEGEISAETWERMVMEIRRTFQESGSVQEWGRAYEWTLSSSEKKAHVTAIPRDGRTRIEIHWAQPVMFVPFLVPTLLLSIISIPILFEELALGLIGIPIYFGLVATILTIARFGLATFSTSRRKRVHNLAQSLAEIAEEGNAEQAKEFETEKAAPQLDMQDLALDEDVFRGEEEKRGRREERRVRG